MRRKIVGGLTSLSLLVATATPAVSQPVAQCKACSPKIVVTNDNWTCIRGYVAAGAFNKLSWDWFFLPTSKCHGDLVIGDPLPDASYVDVQGTYVTKKNAACIQTLTPSIDKMLNGKASITITFQPCGLASNG
jgi:hypothetical protein